jgi:predicted Zn-dependent protease
VFFLERRTKRCLVRFFGFQKPRGVDLKKLSSVVERLSAMSSPTKAPFGSGKMTVALESGVFADFLEAFCDAVTAENVRQKISFFSSDAIGKRVLPEGFSIRSVARMEDSAYGRVFDSEGTTTEDIDVVSNGVLEGLFTDSKNARKMGLPLTGNPSPSNLVFTGKSDPKALSEAKFLFTNLMAFHTIDSISGKFALEGEGFALENGKRVGYVKNVALSGNVKDLLLGIVSSEGSVRWHGNVKTGDVVIANLRVNA